ncbi:MAG TPA: BamA/TamA family outer membrane protein [Caulobacterales bacterium]|nr:BamA/TamA family outer membrane protein [Caulobacterales bacterium]
MARIKAHGRTAIVASAAALALHAAPACAQESNPVVIEGVDAAMARAIALTLPARSPPQTVFDAESIAEEAAARAETWLRSEGYYGAVLRATGEETPPRARVQITPGARFTFTEPVLFFSGAAPGAEALALTQAALAPAKAGAPARAADVLAAEAAAVTALQSSGYAAAKALPRAAIVDHATGKMSVTFKIDAGLPAALGVARLETPGVVKPEFLAKVPRWKPGEAYSPDKLTDLRRDLSSTGAFSRVAVKLADAPNEQGQRDVIVTLDPAKKRAIELGASYSTTEGVGVDAQWTRRNLTGRADQLTIGATLAELDQKFTASLWRPHEILPGRHLRYTVEASHEDTTAYTRLGGSIGVAVEADANARRAILVGANLAVEDYGDAGGVGNAYILSAFVSGKYDRSDSRFDPHEGYVLEARVEPAVSTGAATTAFVRTTGTARGYLTPSRGLTLAARVSSGWVAPVSGNEKDLPLDRRFYAGGGGSVRGYEYKSIYPMSAIKTAPPGGQGLLETSVEARAHIKGPIGAAAFIDGGSAFDSFGAVDMRWGAGIGLRYDLGFAPLRIDIAAPLNKRPGDPNFAFYVSIGQAF